MLYPKSSVSILPHLLYYLHVIYILLPEPFESVLFTTGPFPPEVVSVPSSAWPWYSHQLQIVPHRCSMCNHSYSGFSVDSVVFFISFFPPLHPPSRNLVQNHSVNSGVICLVSVSSAFLCLTWHWQFWRQALPSSPPPPKLECFSFGVCLVFPRD